MDMLLLLLSSQDRVRRFAHCRHSEGNRRPLQSTQPVVRLCDLGLPSFVTCNLPLRCSRLIIKIKNVFKIVRSTIYENIFAYVKMKAPLCERYKSLR